MAILGELQRPDSRLRTHHIVEVHLTILSSLSPSHPPPHTHTLLFNKQEFSNCKACWQDFHFKRLKFLIFFPISSEHLKKFYAAFYYVTF